MLRTWHSSCRNHFNIFSYEAVLGWRFEPITFATMSRCTMCKIIWTIFCLIGVKLQQKQVLVKFVSVLMHYWSCENIRTILIEGGGERKEAFLNMRYNITFINILFSSCLRFKFPSWAWIIVVWMKLNIEKVIGRCKVQKKILNQKLTKTRKVELFFDRPNKIILIAQRKADIYQKR